MNALKIARISYNSSEWQRPTGEGAIEQAHEAKVALERQRACILERKQDLERIKIVQPFLNRRDEVLEDLAARADIVSLPADFGGRRQAAEDSFRDLKIQIDACEEGINGTTETLARIGSSDPLLNEELPVAQLYQQLGSVRKAAADRPQRVTTRDENLTRARVILAQVLPDVDLSGAEVLRPLVGRRDRIQQLATEHGNLVSRQLTITQSIRKADVEANDIASAVAMLPPAVDAKALDALLDSIRRRGDISVERARLVSQRNTATATCSNLAKRLGLNESTAGIAEELQVPALEVVTGFVGRNREHEQQTADARRALNETENDLADYAATIKQLRQQHVPTIDDLALAREHRDVALQAILDAWRQGGSTSFDLSLIDNYRRLVAIADTLADKLRSDATRVTELMLTMERAAKADSRISLQRELIVRLESAHSDIVTDWRAIWDTRIADPPTVESGLSWLREFDDLRERQAAEREANELAEALGRWCGEQVRELRRTLDAMGIVTDGDSNLRALTARAAAALDKLTRDDQARVEHARRTEKNTQMRKEAQHEGDGLTHELEVWSRAWAASTAGLTAEHTSDPMLTLQYVNQIGEVLAACDKANEYALRIAGIDRDADQFRGNAKALAERIGESIDADHTSWVDRLYVRLTNAQRVNERRHIAELSKEEIGSKLVLLQLQLGKVSARIGELRREAKIDADGDLELAQLRSEELRNLQQERSRAEQSLLASSDGMRTIDELRALTDAHRTTLGTDLVAVMDESMQVEIELDAVRDALGKLVDEQRRLRDQDTVAGRSEDVQEVIAEIREDAESYARLRVAGILLARRIDDNRRKNQAPMLRRAGELFRMLTRNSFVHLEADFDDRSAFLVGVREDGRRVTTEGMSEGTRDQLFLSFKLAAVENACDNGEAVPFVVDDILVQFDDERTKAALSALASVAEKTQVILFTHHRRVRESAEHLDAPVGVTVHTLEQRKIATPLS